MKIVRGHGEARWFPSRHDHGLFRLLAYLKLRTARPEPHDGLLFIDRHQSAAEAWTIACWLTLVTACYLAVTLFPRVPLPLALLASTAVALLALQAVVVFVGTVVAPLWNAITRAGTYGFRIANFLILLTLTCASAYFATRPMWVRFVAWQFLGILALNAIAAAIVFLLRDSIEQLETSVVQRIGGPASGQ